MPDFMTLKWQNHQLILLDQTLLPQAIVYRTLSTIPEICAAITTMVVRGAPAIGVTAGYGMALAAWQAEPADPAALLDRLTAAGAALARTRPTAVNLQWAIDRMLGQARRLAAAGNSQEQIQNLLDQEAQAIHQEDLTINRAIGGHLLSLVRPGSTILTHCNAGALATSGYGTALSVFYLARERGITLKAYVDETRPRLQGARLTAFELQRAGIDTTLISDNMAAVVMAQGWIDAVMVGCDRIAANGDVANKIGTFNLGILARHFGIPLYIAAPTPTIDLACPSGRTIPIEERDGREITVINGESIAPPDIRTYNPSFDVTPADYLTAIVTERGIVYPPFAENLACLLA